MPRALRRRFDIAVLAAAAVIGPAGWSLGGAPASNVEVLFDGTRATFEQWRHVGDGSFELRDDGTMRTVGGLGMLWYPVREYADFVLRFEWRDVSADGAGNAGAFIRFPDPEASNEAPPAERHPCQLGVGAAGPAWVAVACGHEIQINDWQDSDGQKTGSVYNFAPLDAEAANRTGKGTWNTYAIRVAGGGDYLVTVTRNGEVINEWRNSPGQFSSRPTDPPTDLRQFARGYVGLQNHGAADVVDLRAVTIEDLSASAGSDEPSAPEDPSDRAAELDPTPVTGGPIAAIGAAGLLVLLILLRRR